MFIKLNQHISDLTVGQSYCVIGIEADDYRLLNDCGQPYLYSAAFFTAVDAAEPADWISDIGADGERYAYPLPLNEPGFFEDFFAGVPRAIAIFWQVINGRLAQVA